MKSNIFPAIKLTLICMAFFMGLYTLAVYSVAQFARNQGKGDVVIQNGKMYYSNIGQLFTSDSYFNSRPSAVAYNAAGSGGSNKGTNNPYYLKEVQTRIDTFLIHNPNVTRSEIPSDLVTASGSGLDPNISVQAARVQVKRIAKIRNLREEQLMALISMQTEKPLWDLFGTEKINVLKLNLALVNLK